MACFEIGVGGLLCPCVSTCQRVFLTWFLTNPAHPLRSSATWPTTTLRLAFRRDGGDFRPNPPSITSNSETGASLPTPIPCLAFQRDGGNFQPHPPITSKRKTKGISAHRNSFVSRFDTMEGISTQPALHHIEM